MADLPKGHKIKTTDFGNITVLRKLGEGGQGAVYEVDFNGQPKALKWYSGHKIENFDKFYKNLENNIKKGKPTDAFLWPEAITMNQGEGKPFGYVMDLCNKKEYSDFSDILNKVVNLSLEMAINSALNIVNSFRSLHRKGLSYQDLNDGNFFINVKTGDVLICDNDNVVPDDTKNYGNIAGKPGYMAPEIVRGDAPPDSYTDFHSLAVILFKLFCRHDPLMGEQYVKSVCITEKREFELYGSNPIFIFDPNNDTNRPVKGVHPNPLNLWPLYPDFLKEAFVSSFVEGMKNRNSRLNDNQWQKILIRFRNELLHCNSCKSVVLLYLQSKDAAIKCSCGYSCSYPLRLDFGEYSVPLFPGVKLYACHTRADGDDYSTVTGEVIMNKNNPSLWGIKNLSGDSWFMIPESGEGKNIDNGSVVPIATNLSIQFKEITGKITKV